MAFIEGWPHLRGGLYEGFHCVLPSRAYRPAEYGERDATPIEPVQTAKMLAVSL